MSYLLEYYALYSQAVEDLEILVFRLIINVMVLKYVSLMMDRKAVDETCSCILPPACFLINPSNVSVNHNGWKLIYQEKSLLWNSLYDWVSSDLIEFEEWHTEKTFRESARMLFCSLLYGRSFSTLEPTSMNCLAGRSKWPPRETLIGPEYPWVGRSGLTW